MSESIKRRIKQNAILRRERRLLAPYDDQLDDLPVISTTASSSTPGGRSSSSSSEDASHSEEFTPPSHSPFSTGTLSSGAVTLPTASSPAASTSSSWSPGLGIPVQAPAQVQLASVMIYLDYVFPFMFPYYRPSLLETGRQWLLGLLCQNEVSFHTAASLSAYFFSLVPQGEGREMHDECKAIVWERLVEQMDMGLKSIQNNISVMSHQQSVLHTGNLLTNKTRIMEEIVQLLIVEVTVRRDVDWMIHLAPAVALFNEVFLDYGLDQSSQDPSLGVLLDALPPLSFPVATPVQKPLPNTSDQSALVFYSSLLLFVDIIASTCLGKAPDLQNSHQSLLMSSSSQSEEKCPVRLETVVGCQNWPLVAIGQISALCAWKREAIQSGNFSVLHLVNHAGPISQALDTGLANLDANPPGPRSNVTGASRRLEGYYSRHDRAIDHKSIATVTRIWAYAAKLYLSVVLSGWQPNSADVQASIVKILILLQTIESPAQLRSLSWPICVAGCLALPTQEQEFRRIVGEVGELSEFGTVGMTLRIMEAVWNARDAVDGNVWDIASSLSILGHSALLV